MSVFDFDFDNLATMIAANARAVVERTDIEVSLDQRVTEEMVILLHALTSKNEAIRSSLNGLMAMVMLEHAEDINKTVEHKRNAAIARKQLAEARRKLDDKIASFTTGW